MKLKVSALLIAFVLTAGSGFGQVDFSGKWVINEHKSSFGEAPMYVYHHTMTIEQKGDSVNLNSEGEDGNGKAYTSSVKMSLAASRFERTIQDSIKLITTYKWSDDKKAALKTQNYFLNDNSQPYRTTKETWSLSANGKELVVDQTVDLPNDKGYSIKAVFDKQ